LPVVKSYQLAFSAEPQTCGRFFSVYNELLSKMQAGYENNRLHDGYITDFAVTNAKEFAKYGLIPLEARHVFEQTLGNTILYDVSVPNIPGTKAMVLRDTYRGDEPITEIAILKPGIQRDVEPMKGVGESISFRPEDVDLWASPGKMAQPDGPPGPWHGVYFLRKWPHFAKLAAKTKPGDIGNDVPIVTNASGLTIRPFKNAVTGQVYLVYDQYIALYNVKEMNKRNGIENIVLVQKIDKKSLDDVCYLVMSPSRLSATLGK